MSTDKHGNPISTGDIVDLVYGGDHHSGEVEKIESLGSVDLLTVRVKAVVPAAAVQLNHERTAAARDATQAGRRTQKIPGGRPTRIATNDQRPTTNDQQPTTNSQKLTANSQ